MKNPSCSTVLIYLLLFLSISYPLFAQQTLKCNPQDQKAVNQIQAAFGINFTGDCCDWEPITCTNLPPYRVTDLLIFNSNISGPIPAAVGDLSYLQILEFYKVPNLIGNIPLAITKLSRLVTLTVSHARLSGPIPTSLLNLKSLTFLDLSFNALTGSIPPQLSQFQNLQVLYLNKNKLTGTIPESFGHFAKSFIFLSLSRNFLTGEIPKSLSSLNLSSIDLSRNNFNGDASFLFGKNKITQNMYLHSNNLTFDLSKVEFPSNLRVLNLSHNNIYGSLPPQMAQLNLKRFKFNVSYNRLCGEIPQGGSLQRFDIDSYVHNKCLCGAPLPACN